MSGSNDPSAGLDLETAIDRLVADELDPSDRSNLLLQLEETPDAWRRCALAFLEDQAWRSTLASARPDRVVPIQPVPVTVNARTRSDLRTVIGSGLAASVVCLIIPVYMKLAATSGERPMKSAATATPDQRQPDVKPVGVQPGQPVGWVSFSDPDEGESLPRPIPILAATEANQQWLEEQPAAIPEYIKAQWERRGFQVEQNHRMVGLNLQDGRQVAIPVDEVALDYVGRRPL